LSLRREIIVKAKFAGQEHLGPNPSRVFEKLTCRAARQRHTPHRPIRRADQLNRPTAQSQSHPPGELAQPDRGRQLTESASPTPARPAEVVHVERWLFIRMVARIAATTASTAVSGHTTSSRHSATSSRNLSARQSDSFDRPEKRPGPREAEAALAVLPDPPRAGREQSVRHPRQIRLRQEHTTLHDFAASAGRSARTRVNRSSAQACR